MFADVGHRVETLGLARPRRALSPIGGCGAAHRGAWLVVGRMVGTRGLGPRDAAYGRIGATGCAARLPSMVPARARRGGGSAIVVSASGGSGCRALGRAALGAAVGGAPRPRLSGSGCCPRPGDPCRGHRRRRWAVRCLRSVGLRPLALRRQGQLAPALGPGLPGPVHGAHPRGHPPAWS